MHLDGSSKGGHARNILRTFSRSIRVLRPDRNFWTFIVFLGVSVLFWCIQTFNGYTSITVSYDIKLVNLPSERIVTSYLPKSVTITLTGRGFSMLDELFGKGNNVVEIDYTSLPKNGECVTIDFNTWKKIFSKVLDDDVSVSSVSISPLDIYTSVGKYKQVPVISQIRMSTAKDHVMLSADITPQYVNVYAPASIYDTISAVYTEPRMFASLSDTTTAMVALERMKGVKTVPDSVKVTMCIDLLTNKSIKVPIEIENLPDEYVVKTFPHEVDVTFKVSTSMYETISADDFRVTANFHDMSSNKQTCKVRLVSSPEMVSSVSVNPSQVEYIIEKCRK